MAMSMADKLKAKEGKMVDRTTIATEPVKQPALKKEASVTKETEEKAVITTETEKKAEEKQPVEVTKEAEESKTEETTKRKRATTEKTKQAESRNKKLGLSGIYLTVPQAAKEKIDVASKANGGLKEYVSRLILEDLKENYEEYKKRVEEQMNNPWNF